mgnify:CR=1 FL=1
MSEAVMNGKMTPHESEILRLLTCGEREMQADRGCNLDTVLAEAEILLERTRQ